MTPDVPGRFYKTHPLRSLSSH